MSRLSDFHPQCEAPSVLVDLQAKPKSITIPHNADTSYLGHGYFRYIGKYPPQIVSYLLNKYKISGPIADTMCGGGTTLIEARLRGLDADGSDINPVSRLISEAVTTPIDPDLLDKHAEAFLNALQEQLCPSDLFSNNRKRSLPIKLKFCAHYFDESTLSDIATYTNELLNYPTNVKHLWQLTLFAILRRVSRANIKKMNLEIDDKKKTQETVLEAASRHIRVLQTLNREYNKWGKKCRITVSDDEADKTSLKSGRYQAVFLHPPYLTNTAFSEFTQLQLALIDINHKDIWKKELRCRGSFLHEPNGLKKYLVGWHRIMQESVRLLRPGGYLFTVVGDGQVDYVRIPIGSITDEFASDLLLNQVDRYLHLLNNHTGQTQSRKMKGQHISIFQKPA
jgi:hypothetical protein